MLARENPNLTRWTAATEWPLTAVAVAFLVAYAWPILEPDLPADLLAFCALVTWLAWGAFALDYGVRLSLAPDRRRYLLRHLPDLAVIVLPLLRPLRLLRLLPLIGALNRHAGSSLRGRVVVYVVGATTLLSGIAALAMLDAERDAADSNITTIGDALWWSATTITTVGYGDRFPVTTEGRLIALGLMVGGIALLGVVTATLASWLIDRVRAEHAADRGATATQVAELMAEVRALRHELARDPAAGGPAT